MSEPSIQKNGGEIDLGHLNDSKEYITFQLLSSQVMAPWHSTAALHLGSNLCICEDIHSHTTFKPTFFSTLIYCIL